MIDIRFAIRTLLKNPGFALTAIISIALAIGANSAIFSLQDGLLFRPLAIERPSEVVTISARPPGGVSEAFSYPDYVDLRDKNRSFQGLVAYRFIAAAFAKDAASRETGLPEIKMGFLVSGNFFDLLGVKPAIGRGFRPDEDAVPGRDAVVVLSRMTLIAETSGESSALARPIRDIIRSLDPNMPVIYVRTVEESFQRGSVALLRVFNTVFSGTSLMGFVLAVIGLYAIVAFQVSRRTREIGIRMALGAQRSQVLKLFVRRASILSIAGIGIGVLLSLAARPALMVAVRRPPSSYDPLMIILIPTSLLLVTLLAAAIPARRAAEIDPQDALRQD